MQNHHHHHQQHVSTTKKPPRPPPLSDSHPSSADPETHTHSPGLPHAPPFRSDDPVTPSSPSSKNGGAIVAVEKYYSPLTSPFPITPPMDPATSSNFPLSDSSQPPHQIVKYSRKEDAPPLSGVVSRGGGERKGIESKSEEEEFVKKVGLGIRVLEIVFCLVSFSVMATDKTQGWSGDSFNRYKEYRFCLTVNIMGFVYSGFQAYDLAYYLAAGKHVISHHLRYQFDFIMDQVVAYLLISASSAAASRVDDWQLNWGKDEFTLKATASVSMSFLAFVAFAMSSLISGYNLCNRDLL